jgi:hypothetical protein
MSKWIVPLPETINIQSLSDWAEKRISEGIPREIISFNLLAYLFPNSKENLSFEQMNAISEIEKTISTVMLN